MAVDVAPAGVASPESAPDPRVRWRPSAPGVAARLLVLAIIGLVALAIPHWLDAALVNIYSRAMVYGIVALSMNQLIGYAGQVSLGHQAFVGVGAFSSAFFLERAGLPWGVAVVATIVFGGFISLGLGAVALRVRGLYFALVTIAYGLFVELVVLGIPQLTGGGAGANAPRPTFAQGDIAYAYLCLVGLGVAWVFDWRLTSSRAGRAIEALRDDERVAASWGIDVRGYKLLAFALSGAVAAFGGALFASIEQIVSPLTFGLGLGLTFILMTVVGGLRSRPGVVIGGFVFAVLPTLLEASHAAWGEGGEVCTTAPPNALQLALLAAAGLGLLAGIVHAWRQGSLGGRIAWTLLAGPVALVALLNAGGGFGWLGDYCLWSTITAEWEPLFGAGLLLITLILFPGGIAQQNEHLFRWLSFRPFHEDTRASAGGGAGGGGTDARP